VNYNLSLRIAVIVPTYNGRTQIEHTVFSIRNQTLDSDLFVVDSDSKDGTQEWIKEHVDTVQTIPSVEFNHGGTRQMMVDRHPGYDIYVFMTQDAYLEDEYALERLVASFVDPCIGTAYGRQLPRHDATVISQHARLFNYPSVSRIVTYEDRKNLGFKAAFSSNSFAAYRATALIEVGGFPSHTIVSEDMYVTARMLMRGWKVAYVSDALCRHSHNYTLLEEFQRYFDIGVFNAREAWIREKFGDVGGEGKRFVVSEIKYLGLNDWYLIPGAIVRNTGKFIAFQLGLRYKWVPTHIRRFFSMHRRFWK